MWTFLAARKWIMIRRAWFQSNTSVNPSSLHKGVNQCIRRHFWLGKMAVHPISLLAASPSRAIFFAI